MKLFVRLLFNSLFFICIFSANAQRSSNMGKVSGKIVDSLTGEAIDFASIRLLNKDGKEINGTTTNDKGIFAIDNLPFGTYKMAVYFIGYKKGTTPNFEITNNNSANVLAIFFIV